MKRVYITTAIASLLILAVFASINSIWEAGPGMESVTVGFVYQEDESTPYTYNFTLAQKALENELGDRVRILSRSNVPENETLEPVAQLVREGCDILFTNSYSDQFVEAARTYPDVQFCQTSYYAGVHDDCPDNYHTFNGEIYQARYVSGVAAGLKLREMIDAGELAPEEALVGYVGAFPTAEVISGFTAFLLGVRSEASEATMRVRYTGAWSSYSREQACAKALIEEGCAVIAQHTDTIGPALACEEASAGRTVFHVGYNEDMISVAPTTSLISVCVNWTPYVTQAVKAVLDGETIENRVEGHAHGNDVSAGFDRDWVQVLTLNCQIAAEGTEERLNSVIDALCKGSLEVFKGDYTGTDPDDPNNTVDLNQGYRENETTSWPTFHYLLEDVIAVEES